MPRFLIVASILMFLVACGGAQATATPTLAPSPTETPIPPTETALPPTETAAPTAVPPTAVPTQVPITGTAKAALNVRQSPSTTAKLLGTLTKGDAITLVGVSQDNKWFGIQYPPDSGTSGWVLSSLVQTSAATDALPVATAQPITETPTLAATKAPPSETITGTIVAKTTVTATEIAKPAVTGTPEPVPANGAPAGSIIFDTFQKGEYQINQIRADGTGLKMLFSKASEPALSPSGTVLAFHKRNGAGAAGLFTSSLDGSNEKQISNSANAGYPTWSPDGNNIAYNLFPNGSLPSQIWRVTKDGSGASEIGIGVRPAWQPGGSSTVMFDGCDGKGSNCYSLYTTNANTPALNNPTLVTSGTNPAWSPNGSEVVFQMQDETGINIYIVNHDGSSKRAVTKQAGHSGDPIWSSDGQWIIYRSDKSGVWALYAVRVDGTSDRKIVDAPVNGDTWDFEKLAIGP